MISAADANALGWYSFTMLVAAALTFCQALQVARARPDQLRRPAKAALCLALALFGCWCFWRASLLWYDGR